ncbi:3'-hydroxy-N-methyl-(S)-coclaurine 4'-O-methyltransferase 2-like [Papaver somniferum]|uniref:3'-hydroxy-N-methyl-(S)-coclaurine 4'-O-methyltransferase 2-like n=1 Tax=Papaver somniferum TaxID=3469 RepID=UPI000E7009E2|nr:3'-hydroxy-N-methyl-(S)-coclaurine 4'-O-methyltransferase 2-like [Papaver somniferum]
MGSSVDVKPAETQEVGIKDQAQLWNIIYGFADTLVVGCVVEIGIPDIIKNNNGSITLSELVSKLPIPNVNSDYLYRILRYLVNLNILGQETCNGGAEKVYSLKPVGTLLLRDAETSMVQTILGVAQKEFMVPWHFMKEGLGNGSTTAFKKGMGMDMWKYLEGNPDQSQLFNEGMAEETRLLTKTLIEDCRDTFQGLDSLVDIGGGNGTTIMAIFKAFPHIKCTLYDLPHVIANSHDHPDIKKVPGDMFKSVPSAQAILLKCILHDWNDEHCVNILKKCKEAIPEETGKVIIVDVALDEESEDELTKARFILDIDMLVNTGGRERTPDDWENLLQRAGFRSHKISPIRAIQSVIEAFP